MAQVFVEIKSKIVIPIDVLDNLTKQKAKALAKYEAEKFVRELQKSVQDSYVESGYNMDDKEYITKRLIDETVIGRISANPI